MRIMPSGVAPELVAALLSADTSSDEELRDCIAEYDSVEVETDASGSPLLDEAEGGAAEEEDEDDEDEDEGGATIAA